MVTTQINKKTSNNYVIPISKGETAVVHCLSFFATTTFTRYAKCDKCPIKHIRHKCCAAISWQKSPMSLRCTTKRDSLNIKDATIPYIDVTVVPKQVAESHSVTKLDNRTVAVNHDVYYCHTPVKQHVLTAGSHIALGWILKGKARKDLSDNPIEPTNDYGMDQYKTIKANENFFNVQHKEIKFTKLYNSSSFLNLWVANDIKVELKKHGSIFTCNGTDYILPNGSRCLTPSRRAIFVMTNCNIVESVFIVVGVIILLIFAYVIFNFLIFLWNLVMNRNKKAKYKDDLKL